MLFSNALWRQLNPNDCPLLKLPDQQGRLYQVGATAYSRLLSGRLFGFAQKVCRKKFVRMNRRLRHLRRSRNRGRRRGSGVYRPINIGRFANTRIRNLSSLNIRSHYRKWVTDRNSRQNCRLVKCIRFEPRTLSRSQSKYGDEYRINGNCCRFSCSRADAPSTRRRSRC